MKRFRIPGHRGHRLRPHRGRFFRRERKQRVRYIALLPSLITILNGVCGFTAIAMASRVVKPDATHWSSLTAAGYMVLMAMVADMLDGRLARMSQSTSSFGGQLDSLCDMISFGAAPAFLMLRLLENKLELTSMIWEGLLHRFIWLAAVTYIACAAIRLARFNVENEENEAAHMSFKGLPSPAAAGVVISLVIFHQHADFPAFNDVLVYLLPFITVGAALLMVSQIRYPHVLNVYLAGKKPLTSLFRILLLLGIAVCGHLQIALVLAFCSFAAGGVVRWLYGVVFRRPRPVATTDLAPGAEPNPLSHGS